MKSLRDYRAPDGLLSGRNILVTGASNGIGRVAALCFAQYGARVLLTGRNTKKLEQVCEAIEALDAPQPLIHPLDLQQATPKDFSDFATMIETAVPCLDGLLHNAALLGQRSAIEDITPESWDAVMRVNISAEFLLSRALLPLMRRSQDASIIFTSSGVGRVGYAYWGAYSVSKFAVEGLMQVLASELEKTSPIRANSLDPGACNTAMRRAAYPAEPPTNNPPPEQIMPAYLYLMGPESSGVTGGQFNAQ